MTTKPGSEHPLSEATPPVAARIGAAFAGNAALTALLAVAHLSGVLGWSLAAFAALTAGLTWWAGLWVGLGSAVCGWLFFAGFIDGRHAHLVWHATADLARIAVLAGAAVVIWSLRTAVIRAVSGQREAPRGGVSVSPSGGNTSGTPMP